MNENRKIAFLCHPYHRGGVTRWMANAAIFAAGAGAEVFFITVEPVKKFFSAGDRESMYELLSGNTAGLRLISSKVNFTFEFGTEAYRASIYSRLMRQHVPLGVPVIVSDDPAVWAAAAGIADKYPMIGVLHGDQDVYYNLAKKYEQQLSICVCVSNRIKQTAERKVIAMATRKLFRIPCGINLPAFAPYEKTTETIRLIFIGRLTDYEKRAADLVSICSLLHQQSIAFHLDIVGNDDDSAKDFTERFTSAGVGDLVSFHGWQNGPAVQQLLNKSDVLLLTSNSEGMPLVMMEALASGCAFTGTRVSGIEDFEHLPAAAKCVMVYKIGDIDDAVLKIKKSTAVPARERQLAARKLAEAEFSMQACVDKYFSTITTMRGTAATARPIWLSVSDRLKSNALALARYIKMSIRSKKH